MHGPRAGLRIAIAEACNFTPYMLDLKLCLDTDRHTILSFRVHLVLEAGR